MHLQNLEELQKIASEHKFDMAAAMDDTPIEQLSERDAYTRYIDWKTLLKMNDNPNGNWHHFLKPEKRKELIEKIKKYENDKTK